eukprot:scaffold4239_cov156-Amphora_coffeaeformis.AAC.7
MGKGEDGVGRVVRRHSSLVAKRALCFFGGGGCCCCLRGVSLLLTETPLTAQVPPTSRARGVQWVVIAS